MARSDFGPNFRTPFGKNEWLGSTVGIIHESATCAKGAVPSETIDGISTKVLQPGQVMALITSGADADKVGVYDDSASDGRQLAANIVGVCNTFVPWTLVHRDVDIDIVKHAWGVAESIFVYEGSDKVALPDATIDITDLQKAGNDDTGISSVDIKLRNRAAAVEGVDYGTWPVP